MSREIDALVAEHVMGLDEVGTSVGFEGSRLRYVSSIRKVIKLASETEEIKTMTLVPDYSTDISAAWEVVEKIGVVKTSESSTDLFDISRYPEGYEVAFGFTNATHKSAPMAICLAALKAKGIEIPKGEKI